MRALLEEIDDDSHGPGRLFLPWQLRTTTMRPTRQPKPKALWERFEFVYTPST